MKKTPRNIQNLTFEEVKQWNVLVTLDPETANGTLVLSENQRRVRYPGPLYRKVFPQPFQKQSNRRFTASACVLGREGFCSGRSFWEVEIMQEACGWAVGVARESIDRNFTTQPPEEENPFDFSFTFKPMESPKGGGAPTESPKGGVWALRVDNGRCFALTDPCTAVLLHHSIKKLGVYLDCEAGQVSLFNGDTKKLLYTFSDAALRGQVYPYFNLCGANYYENVQGTDLRLL